jgi:acyl-CoA thioesterase-1
MNDNDSPMKTILTLLFFLVLTACSDNEVAETAVKPSAKPIPTFRILALGDSLTEGLGVQQKLAYPAQLQEQLAKAGYETIEVINAGLSGETTSGLKNRLNWVLKQKPDLTILCIGANDAMRGLPLELSTNNLDEIINTIQKSDSDLILAGMEIYDNLGKEYVAGFKDIYPKMVQKYSLAFIPFFLDGVAGDTTLNQADMIHPNSNGYEIIVKKNILPVVLDYLKNKNIREKHVTK